MIIGDVVLNYKRLSKNDLDYIRCHNLLYTLEEPFSFLDKKDQDMLGAYLFFYSNLWDGRSMLLQHGSRYYEIFPECGAYYNGYKKHEIIGWYVVPYRKTK